MGIAVRNEGKKVNSNINVTPMVDVMLVLLIIFMVITPMLQNKVNVDLPKSTMRRRCRTPTRKMPSLWRSPAMAACFSGPTRCPQPIWARRSPTCWRTRPNKEVYLRVRRACELWDGDGSHRQHSYPGVDTLGLLTEQPNAGAAGSM